MYRVAGPHPRLCRADCSRASPVSTPDPHVGTRDRSRGLPCAECGPSHSARRCGGRDVRDDGRVDSRNTRASP